MMPLRLRERSHLGTRHRSSGALATGDAGDDYFSSNKHYASLARRTVAALHSGGGWVLITGDPPADTPALSEALRKVAGVNYEPIVISCGPGLTCEDLDRAFPVVAGRRATAGVTMMSESSLVVSPLFVLDDFDQLSDKQIAEIYKGSLQGGLTLTAVILVASLNFCARLEQPTLHFLKEHLNAHFRVQEVADDEALTLLHNQLLVRRDRQIEARSLRRGIAIGLGASGVLSAACIAVFLIVNPMAELIRATTKSTGERSTVSEKKSMLQPAEERVEYFGRPEAIPKTETKSATAISTLQPLSSSVAETSLPVARSARTYPPAETRLTSSEAADAIPKTQTSSPSATASPPIPSSTAVASPASVVPSVTAHSPADLHTSDAEIAALLRRGDTFLKSGDITSARLFYERAAAAGSGPAALQLGATFDPVMLGRVDARVGFADRARALLWYRRARDLGMVEAERGIKRIETSSLGAGQSAPLK
jgi:hypothetical protein